jgi:hypothetical protein
MAQLFRCLPACALVLLAGCGNLQALKVASIPGELHGRSIETSDVPVSLEDLAPKARPMGNGGVYLAQSGGGSAVLGILLGPAGIALNSANINAETAKLAKSSVSARLLQINTSDELAAAWGPRAAETSNAEKVRAAPYLLLYVDDARQTLYPIVGLRVASAESSTSGSRNWSGHYLYALPTMPASVLQSAVSDSDEQSFRLRLRDAYMQLRTELANDLSASSSPAPATQLASIKSTYLKATQMGFAGFTSGDVGTLSGGAMSIRVNIENYGPAMSRAVPYFVWYFPSASQYSFDLGPEPRRN